MSVSSKSKNDLKIAIVHLETLRQAWANFGPGAIYGQLSFNPVSLS